MFEEKNCLNILFEIKTFNKICEVGILEEGLGWVRVGWGGEAKKEGRGRGENKVIIKQL